MHSGLLGRYRCCLCPTGTGPGNRGAEFRDSSHRVSGHERSAVGQLRSPSAVHMDSGVLVVCSDATELPAPYGPDSTRFVQPHLAQNRDEVPVDMLAVGVHSGRSQLDTVSQNSNHRITVHAWDAMSTGPLSTTASPAACAASGDR